MRDESRILSLPMTAAYFRLILRRFGSTAGAARGAARRHGVATIAARRRRDAEISGRARSCASSPTLSALARAGLGARAGRALDGVDARSGRGWSP